MNSGYLAKALLGGLLYLWPLVAAANDEPLALIVNTDSGVTAIEREDVVNIFMGRYQELPSGISAIPVDYLLAKGAFYDRLVNKRLSEINGYWARLVFSGRASPPLQLRNEAELLEFVAGNKGAIAYIYQKDLDDRVRAVRVLPGNHQSAAVE